MRGNPAQFFDEDLRHLRCIVDIADHSVFKRDASARFLKIAFARIKQDIYGIFSVNRHDTAAHLIRRCMQGDGERQLKVFLRQAVNLVHNAAGREADMAHADVHALRRIDKV